MSVLGKECSRCRKQKPISEYYRDTKGCRYGVRAECKQCNAELHRKERSQLQVKLHHQEYLITRRDDVEHRYDIGELEEPDTKRCGRCERTLPLSDFNLKRGELSRRESYCKKCNSEYLRQWRSSRRI